MRNLIAYCLLLLYSFAVIKPVLPILKDEMAHIFWKTHHLSTVHHHHGNHHTEKEIAHSAHEEENKENGQVVKIAEPVSLHIVVQSFFSFQPTFLKKQVFGTANDAVAFLCLDIRYPPPKFC